jgi:hypothetical protein
MTTQSEKDLTIEELMELLKQGKVKIQILKNFEFNRFSYLAERLLKRVTQSSDNDAEGDLIAVVLLQATALECFLNDKLIQYSRETFGKGSKNIAEGMLSGSTRSKIFRIVPIMSGSTKILDVESDTVKILLNLIKTRNKIAHTTEYYRDEFEDYGKRALEPSFTSTINLEQCEKYQKALQMFITAIWDGSIDKKWQHELIINAIPDNEE